MGKTTAWTHAQILSFIEAIKSFPVLWDVKSPMYKDRVARITALSNVVAQVQESIPHITVITTRDKLKNLRSQFQREVAKIRRTQVSGAGADDIHKPTLWCYNELCFLMEGDVHTQGTSTLTLDEGPLELGEDIEALAEECNIVLVDDFVTCHLNDPTPSGSGEPSLQVPCEPSTSKDYSEAALDPLPDLTFAIEKNSVPSGSTITDAQNPAAPLPLSQFEAPSEVETTASQSTTIKRTAASTSKGPPTKKKRKESQADLVMSQCLTQLGSINEELKEKPPRYHSLAMHLTESLKELPKEQRIQCTRLWNKVLYLGEMGLLTPDTDVV